MIGIEVIGLATSVASRRASANKREAQVMWHTIAEDAQAFGRYEIASHSGPMLLYKFSIWAAT